MIRFDQRVADDPRTERIFKKLVHPGQDAVKLVDRDGIPLRLPNSATFSRLQSSYVLSPRGVPTRRSNHSYSGQLSQGKMHPLISSLEPQDTVGFNPLQAYNLSSAGSSRNYMSTANTPSAKKQGLPSRPARKITTASMATANMTTASMATASMAKSASTARTGKYLSSDESIGSEVDLDQFNPSIQGQRLEKEWSALSNCRALKRSSEIVSHRVDRMYFMTGNSMKIQQKFLVEETDLNQLKELSVARAASRQSRNSSRVKGDIYRPNRSARSTLSGGSDVNSSVNGIAAHKSKGKKENNDPASNIMVSQKALIPKPLSSRKSPLQGWSADDTGSGRDATPVVNGFTQEKSLHEGKVEDGDEARVGSPVSNTGERTENANLESSRKDNPSEDPIFQTEVANGQDVVVNGDGEGTPDVKADDNGDDDDIKKNNAGDNGENVDENDGKINSVQNDDVTQDKTGSDKTADGQEGSPAEN